MIKLSPLPFELNALEPAISRKTLEYHHGKHHKKYVDTVNELIKGTAFESKSLEEILHRTYKKKAKLYNNAAQAWNHDFFWKCLSPNAVTPSKSFKNWIEKNFDSFKAFKTEFTTKSKDHFASGWTWLVKDSRGRLKVRDLHDAGNPLAEIGEIPILNCDLWEHAYYLDYQNERPKYLDSFWSIVNWDFVENRFEAPPEEPWIASAKFQRPNKTTPLSRH